MILSALHLIIDEALIGKEYVKMTDLCFEYDVTDSEANDAASRNIDTSILFFSSKFIFFVLFASC